MWGWGFWVWRVWVWWFGFGDFGWVGFGCRVGIIGLWVLFADRCGWCFWFWGVRFVVCGFVCLGAWFCRVRFGVGL